MKFSKSLDWLKESDEDDNLLEDDNLDIEPEILEAENEMTEKKAKKNEDRESDKANFFTKVPKLCSKYRIECKKLENDSKGNLFKLSKGDITATLNLYGPAVISVYGDMYRTTDKLKNDIIEPAQALIACLNEIPFLK